MADPNRVRPERSDEILHTFESLGRLVALGLTELQVLGLSKGRDGLLRYPPRGSRSQRPLLRCTTDHQPLPRRVTPSAQDPEREPQ